MPRLITLSLAMLAAATGWACAPESGPASVDAGPPSEVVATVNSQPITQAELDTWIKNQIFEREVESKNSAQQYEIRSGALEAMIDEHVLEGAATESGTSIEEVMKKGVEAIGPVSDDEVSEFFEKHRSRFRPDDTLETRGDQIRGFLESERQKKALDGLRSGAEVAIRLEAPRFEVAATGPSLGPDDAPVTIVEFSDYQCPFCSRAEPTVKQVLERYPSQVRIVFRHLPLDSIHPRARPAAEAAVCAEDQGHFWAFHEKLFANQKALADEQLAGYAKELGLDVTQFDACRADADAKDRVERDVKAAQAAGITGTPAFFVNGVMLSGAKPIDDFVRVIEAELAKGEPANAS